MTKKRRTESPLKESRPYDPRCVPVYSPAVDEILNGASKWDSDTVIELLRQGWKPPLKRLKKHNEKGFTLAECVFLKPDGTRSVNIYVPYSLISVLYGKK